jgi:tetratricopeptide (TPR) repeat protein
MSGNASREELVALAAALERDGRASEAMAAYERLLESWPGLPDCWYNLARLQRLSGRYEQALASYQEALERHVARPEEIHINRGVIFSDHLNRYDAAERELKKALQINPNYVPALINYANLHEDLGRRELAAKMYERLLALEPDSPSALARYSQLKNFTDINDPLIGQLRKALDYPGISPAARANVEFALGRALDACGDYEGAFQTYRQANRHSRESAPPGIGHYDLALEENSIDRLIGIFAQNRSAPPQPQATRPQPIFICGMFRSGSTLLEQLLAGHPSITPGGELDFIPRMANATLAPFPESFASIQSEQLGRLAADYRAMLKQRFPEAVNVTDKRPDNFRYIGLIKALFPEAKIVHTVRDALDNCLSIYFLHLDPAMSYALDLMDIGHQYRQYLRLMSHWKSLYGADIIEVSYDALVRDPKPQLERVLGSLGLAWDERCGSVDRSRAVKTASVWQVREPLYLSSSGRARHYARHVADLQKYIDFPM